MMFLELVLLSGALLHGCNAKNLGCYGGSYYVRAYCRFIFLVTKMLLGGCYVNPGVCKCCCVVVASSYWLLGCCYDIPAGC